jgi:hypothetical protein
LAAKRRLITKGAGVRVDADHEAFRVARGDIANERSVAGSEVDVQGAVLRRALS